MRKKQKLNTNVFIPWNCIVYIFYVIKMAGENFFDNHSLRIFAVSSVANLLQDNDEWTQFP